MKNKLTLAALSVALLTMAGTVFAAEAQEDKWQFGVTAPLWAPRIDGNVTLRGHKENVGISFSELKDHLDASFSLGLEARKDKFGFSAGVGYMRFGAGDNGVDDDLKFLIVDAVFFYRLVKTGEEHPFILEATAGIRYWGVWNDLMVKGPGGNTLIDGSEHEDLVDPMIGLRGSQYLTRKLHLDFAADIGGFGISDNTSDLDWSATGLLTYDFAKWFSFSAGYKALAVDVSRGGGDSKKGVDIVMHGVMLAAKFKF